MSFRGVFSKEQEREFLVLITHMNDAIKVATRSWEDYFDGVRPLRPTLLINLGLLHAVAVLQRRCMPGLIVAHDFTGTDPREPSAVGLSHVAANATMGPINVLFASMFHEIDPEACPDLFMSVATGEWDEAIAKNYYAADEHFMVSFAMLAKWNLWNFKRTIMGDRGPAGDMQPHEEGTSSSLRCPEQTGKQKYDDDKAHFYMGWVTAFFPSSNEAPAAAGGGNAPLADDVVRVQDILTDGLRLQVINRFRAMNITLVFRLQLYLIFHRVRRAALAANDDPQ